VCDQAHHRGKEELAGNETDVGSERRSAMRHMVKEIRAEQGGEGINGVRVRE